MDKKEIANWITDTFKKPCVCCTEQCKDDCTGFPGCLIHIEQWINKQQSEDEISLYDSDYIGDAIEVVTRLEGVVENEYGFCVDAKQVNDYLILMALGRALKDGEIEVKVVSPESLNLKYLNKLLKEKEKNLERDCL